LQASSQGLKLARASRELYLFGRRCHMFRFVLRLPCSFKKTALSGSFEGRLETQALVHTTQLFRITAGISSTQTLLQKTKGCSVLYTVCLILWCHRTRCGLKVPSKCLAFFPVWARFWTSVYLSGSSATNRGGSLPPTWTTLKMILKCHASGNWLIDWSFSQPYLTCWDATAVARVRQIGVFSTLFSAAARA